MAFTHTSKSSAVRARIGHPVVDVDGHILEYMPLVEDYIRQEAERRLLKRVDNARSPYEVSLSVVFGRRMPDGRDWYAASLQERHDWRLIRPPFRSYPTKLTLDAATSRLPRLFRERFGELGLDFSVLYPSFGRMFASLPDDELRPVACRGFNRYLWDLYGSFSDVMTPAAVIPAHTPQEAIEELEFAVGTLGFKAVMLPSFVRRPLRGVVDTAPHLAPYATYVDKLGLDSEHDYDPVWRKCVELKVSPTFHSGSYDWDSRNSPSNTIYNHVGHFAAASEAVCKALFLGGVTYRFPELGFAFLEAGVGWALTLYADLVSHWEKRNGQQLDTYDLGQLDQDLFSELVQRYSDGRLLAKVNELDGQGFFRPDREQDPAMLDEFRQVHVERAEQIKDRFVPSFFFGCEADDAINALAFNTKVIPFNARLQAVFSTDFGHWDVPDMRRVLEEAYELVEHGLFSEADFRDFVFTNPVKLHTRLNRDFFRGTAIEAEVDALLAEPPAGAG